MPRREAPYLLITDIGSTSTKALLLARSQSGYTIAAEASAATTVEKPEEDVKLGVARAARAVAERTGIAVLGDDGRPEIPYMTTSSAGGGLQILVFGLTSVDTGKAAKLTAHAAGGVILRTFTIDDQIPTIHKMRMIRDLHPDLILMAGGIDGGDIANIVRLAEILKLANPTTKFDAAGRLPLVFCGNPEARKFIEGVLAEKFDVHFVDNVRPNLQQLNPDPARDRILQLFMETVMQRAPGYGELATWTAEDIRPTPSAVERILRLYAEAQGESAVMVDIGGATTDVFSNIYGEYRRTVAANIGLSYSICNVLAEAGYAGIAGHLPAGLAEDDVRDYIANKMLNPTYVPREGAEFAIEHALAAEGIAHAWRQHRDTNFRLATLGFLDRLKSRVDVDPFEETFLGIDMRQFFQISDIQTLIATGGVLSHAPRALDVLRIMTDGFKPTGITKIVLDRGFRSPHLGLLAESEPKAALELFARECLDEIAYVVAPLGKVVPGKAALRVTDHRNGEELALDGGAVHYCPGGGDFTIQGAAGIHVEKNRERTELQTDLPVLFDCRGRGAYFSGVSLAHCAGGEFAVEEMALVTAVRGAPPEVQRGEYNFRRALPYEGEIFVRPGEPVTADAVIGQNIFTPPRIYIVDMQRMVGYQHELAEKEIEEGVLVKVGDAVNAGQRMFKFSGGLLGGHYYCNSPVRGHVRQIEPNGMVILREIQDYTDKPVRVDVADALGVKPKDIRRHLKFEVGDFVQRGEELAHAPGRMFPVLAPATGTLKEIDTGTGRVILQYDLQPMVIKSFVAGTVTQVDPQLYAVVTGQGACFPGRIGFGPESTGALHIHSGDSLPAADLAGRVLVSFTAVDESFLRACAAAGVSGLIAPALPSSAWVAFSGEELGVAVTGGEDIPFAIVLTEGFGRAPMNAVYRKLLEGLGGREASLAGRTQIRAGVTRPMAVISD